jgi:adenylosuccinate lyase
MSGAHPADSVIFGHLWTTPEASALFCDEGRTQAWLLILAALAQAQAEAGLVPMAAAEAIRAHADVSLLDLDLVAEQTRLTGHSTMGLIRALREVLPAHAREWVYYGATVQDLSDTWFALTFRTLGDIAERDVTRMRDRALDLAAEYRDTPMCGRTHGQPGLPVTFGFKAAVWAAELDRHLTRLRQGRGRWEVAQLGGALGTMEFWGERALDVLERFAAQLGFPGSPPGTGSPSSSGCSRRSPRRPGRSATRCTSCSGRRSGSCRRPSPQVRSARSRCRTSGIRRSPNTWSPCPR